MHATNTPCRLEPISFLGSPITKYFLLLAFLWLSAIQSVIWNGVEHVYWLEVSTKWFLSNLTASSKMSQPSAEYFFYGHFTIILYGILALQLCNLKSKISKVILIFSLLLLSAAAIGDFISYWLSEAYGPWLRHVGFWFIELPTLSILTLLWFGLGICKCIKQKALNSLLLILPISQLSVIIFQYLPHSLLVVVFITLYFLKNDLIEEKYN